MADVKKGHFVKVHYAGTLEDGSTFDSSKDRDPLEVLAGEGMLIKGFDNALIGMKQGEEKDVTIKAEDAYGPRREDMVRPVPKKEFGDMELKKGMTIGIRAPTGQVFPVTVVEIKEEEVVIDGNHPLAGKTLHFNIKVEEAREATDADKAKFAPPKAPEQTSEHAHEDGCCGGEDHGAKKEGDCCGGKGECGCKAEAEAKTAKEEPAEPKEE